MILHVGIRLQMGPVPPVQQIPAGGDPVRGDGLGAPIRAALQKAVDVIPLLLVLFPLQVGQMVDFIQVVKPIPVRAEFELPRVNLLHRPAVRHRHAGEAKGNLPLLGVGPEGLQHRLQRAVP